MEYASTLNNVSTFPRSRIKKSIEILLVDDNPANLKLYSTTLSLEGFSVKTASTAENARLLIKARETPFDLVLSDISLPGESGFELISWLRKNLAEYRDIPVVLITSVLPEVRYRILGYSLGAVDYIVGCTNPEELIVRLKKAIKDSNRISQLKQNLATSETLATQGLLLAAINHEIKNLSTIIVSVSSLVESNILKSPERTNSVSQREKDLLTLLVKGSKMLKEFSHSVSTLFDTADQSKVAINLANLTDEVLDILSFRLEGCIVEKQYESVDIKANVNPVKLRLVFLNLILNAFEAIKDMHSREPGKIIVRLENLYDSNSVRVSIIDDGIGFKRDETRVEFKPFESTKHLRGGQGLGLWLSAKLLSSQEGSLSLSSKGPGLGCRAQVELPGAELRGI